MVKETNPASSITTATLAKTDSAAFRTSFRADPVAALSAKGLVLPPNEARRLAEKVRELSARPGRPEAQAGDVDVSVTIKIRL